MRYYVVGLIAGCGIWLAAIASAGAQVRTLEFESSQLIPDIKIDGKGARIHTQGLYVTRRYYYVTGRWEGAPKRAVFLRIDRKHPDRVEHLDITPAPTGERDDVGLDHPGGFDFDGRGFWIPISASRPQSRTVVVRLHVPPKRPLAEAKLQEAFQWSDHIGALAVDSKSKDLFGANWDTKLIYRWKADGMLVRKTPREELMGGEGKLALAVQDWKGIGEGRLLAGGIDKSRQRDANQPRAVVAVLDMDQRKVISEVRLPRPADARHTLTREGLAVFEDRLYFLPGDLGEPARVFRYRWRR